MRALCDGDAQRRDEQQHTAPPPGITVASSRHRTQNPLRGRFSNQCERCLGCRILNIGCERKHEGRSPTSDLVSATTRSLQKLDKAYNRGRWAGPLSSHLRARREWRHHSRISPTRIIIRESVTCVPLDLVRDAHRAISDTFPWNLKRIKQHISRHASARYPIYTPYAQYPFPLSWACGIALPSV